MSNGAPPPGWYRNPHGQTQWWDGGSWGALAPQAAQAPVRQQPAAQPALPATAAPVRPKPKTSPFVWISLGLAVLGLLLALISAFSAYSFMNELAYQGGFGTTMLPTYLQGGATALSLAAIVFAVIGLVKSAKKGLSVVALILAFLVPASPVLLMILFWIWWFAAGIFSQLTGGPVVG